MNFKTDNNFSKTGFHLSIKRILAYWKIRKSWKFYSFVTLLFLAIVFYGRTTNNWQKIKINDSTTNGPIRPTNGHIVATDGPIRATNGPIIATDGPIKVNGYLRWKPRDPPKGSIRDSSVFREFFQSNSSTNKTNYIKRWTNSTLSNRKTDEPKKILFWSDFGFDKVFKHGEGKVMFTKGGCPYTNCFATKNTDLVKPQEADAIIFHQLSNNGKELPKEISPHTSFVFYLMESPEMFDRVTLPGNVDNIVNYTMGYWEHSDIFNPYGHIVVKDNSTTGNFKNINYAFGKTKLAVWFVSHCGTPSRREKIVETLQKYIDIDVYGKCGTKKCGKDRRRTSETCTKSNEKIYKFYLSFENSLCTDYITEKFFGALKYDMVPVVYGLGPYDTIAPPKSYIDVFDFKNLKELADYLLYLDKNDTAYNEYFSWKKDYASISVFMMFKPPSYNRISWCQLCEKLNTDFTPQTYTQPKGFRGSKDNCLSANLPELKDFISGI